MNHARIGLGVASCILAGLAAVWIAQPSAEATSASAASRIDQCRWLAGSWTELDEGGSTEEHWSRPSANSMVGMCRMIRNGKVALYELMLIEDNGTDVELRIRHYRWNMVDADKEPLVWKLVRASESELVFENPTQERVRRIEYRRPDDQSITCTLVSTGDGGETPRTFELRRATPAARPSSEKPRGDRP